METAIVEVIYCSTPCIIGSVWWRRCIESIVDRTTMTMRRRNHIVSVGRMWIGVMTFGWRVVMIILLVWRWWVVMIVMMRRCSIVMSSGMIIGMVITGIATSFARRVIVVMFRLCGL